MEELVNKFFRLDYKLIDNQKRILRMFYLLKANNFKFEIVLKELKKCSNCIFDGNELIYFDCLHTLCPTDFCFLIIDKMENFTKIDYNTFLNKLSVLKCCICDKGNILIEKIMRNNEMIRFLKEKYEEKKKNDTIIEDEITLEKVRLTECLIYTCCNYIISKSSFNDDMDERIKNFGPFKCINCNEELADEFIRNNLENQKYILVCDKKFQAFIKDNTKYILNDDIINSSNDEEILISCIKPGCESQYFVNKNDLLKKDPSINCSKCNTLFCPKCGKTPHFNKTCKEWLDYVESLEDENVRKVIKERKEKEKIAILENLRLQGMVYCPWCETLIQHVNGCKFMTCSTNICKNSKYFCFICLAKFEKNDNETHFQHFFNSPYGEKCINKP